MYLVTKVTIKSIQVDVKKPSAPTLGFFPYYLNCFNIKSTRNKAIIFSIPFKLITPFLPFSKRWLYYILCKFIFQ